MGWRLIWRSGPSSADLRQERTLAPRPKADLSAFWRYREIEIRRSCTARRNETKARALVLASRPRRINGEQAGFGARSVLARMGHDLSGFQFRREKPLRGHRQTKVEVTPPVTPSAWVTFSRP